MFGARNDFLTFFPNCTGSSLFINPQLLKGAAHKTKIHSALWKFYLLISPNINKSFAKDDDWIRILKEKRDEFFALKEKYFIQESQIEDVNDPLQSKESDQWKQYYTDCDLRGQIRRDVDRAFQELDYFHQEDTLQCLEDIIFLFCRTHPSYGYPQGLHEIAAFVLYVLHEEMTSESNDTISFIFSQNAVIPDTYYVFSAIAELIEPYYRPAEGQMNYLADISEKIQNTIVAKRAPKLTEVLVDFGIAPHSYMMKWFRLLFLSVFKFEDVKTMWDIIFSYSPNLNIIANIGAAMLLNAQKKLLVSDSTEALQLLFHYPEVPNPARFAVEAAAMMERGKKKSKVDLVTAVSERLNELSHGLNEVCNKNGYEEALPYVMDLCRTRDVLLGILPLDEMLPLDQALEMFKPQTVDHQVKQLPPEAVITQNTKIVPPESSRPITQQQPPSKPKSSTTKNPQKNLNPQGDELQKTAKQRKIKKGSEKILFGGDENNDLFSSSKVKIAPAPSPKSAPPPQKHVAPSSSAAEGEKPPTTNNGNGTTNNNNSNDTKQKVANNEKKTAKEKTSKEKQKEKSKPQPPPKEAKKDTLFDEDDDIDLMI